MHLKLIFEQDLIRVEDCALAVNKDRLLIARWLTDGYAALADEVGIMAERITGLDQLIMVKTLKERINVNSEVQYTLIFQLRKILVSKKKASTE